MRCRARVILLLMDSCLVWNVRGLNSPQKQKDIRSLLLEWKVGLVCLVETKIKPSNFDKVYQCLFQGWCISSNFNYVKGGRILVAWLQNHFEVNVKRVHPQFIHMDVLHCALRRRFQFTVLYAENEANGRKELWDNLKRVADTTDGAWVVAGDFNCPLTYEDRIGRPIQAHEIAHFVDCTEYCNICDMCQVGSAFTWTNKQLGDSRVYSKIDRTLVNPGWVDLFPQSFVHYKPEGVFDHFPAVIHF